MTHTLHYDFAADKSLAARTGPTLDIVRATIASYYDSAGVLQTAGTGVARFDHAPVSPFTSKGLLIEEARTNICLQSEDLSTTWINSGSVDSQNEGTAPDGTNTANKIIDPNTGGTGTVRMLQNLTFATSTVYVYSCFLKEDQLDWGLLQVTGLGTLSIFAYFDLTNGAIGASVGTGNTSEFIEDVGNGWYRCGIVFISDASDTSGTPRVIVAEANADSEVDLDDTSSIFVWGAQLEAGEFPTSYIPTVASSVTRNADVVSTTDVDWYNDDEGTIYSKASQPNVISAIGIVTDINDSSASDRIINFANGANDQQFVIEASGTQVNLVATAGNDWSVANVVNEIAASFIANDVDCYINGSRIGTGDQSSAMPAGIIKLNIGTRYASDQSINGHIAEIRYYPERLSNTILEDMSNGVFPPEPTAKGASTRKTKRRKRYVVEVEGKFFDVSSIAEAESVLKNIRDVAEESASRDVTTAIVPKPPRVVIKTAAGKPVTSKIIQRDIKRTQEVINRNYRQAAERIARDQELTNLMQLKIQAEDEEDAILALLL